MVKRRKFLSLWKVSSSEKDLYVVWYNRKDIVKIFSEKNRFMNETLQIEKISIKRKLLISLDFGQNYFRIDKILKMIDNKVVNDKIKEPYILNNAYILKI